MSNEQHPITPPPELVEEWIAQVWHEGTSVQVAASDIHIATEAARWGAERELEACVAWMQAHFHPEWAEVLRAVRRPKPSLKEEALAKLEAMERLWEASGNTPSDTIRRALEQLDD